MIGNENPLPFVKNIIIGFISISFIMVLWILKCTFWNIEKIPRKIKNFKKEIEYEEQLVKKNK